MNIRKTFTVMILIACLMSGCAANPMTAIYNNNEKISSDTNSFNLDKAEQTIDGCQYTASVERMEGMDTIWSYTSEKDETLDVVYTIKTYSGKLKLVLISPDGTLTTIVECDSEMDTPTQSAINVQKGINRIKIVAGENTKFDIDISISEGIFEKMGL